MSVSEGLNLDDGDGSEDIESKPIASTVGGPGKGRKDGKEIDPATTELVKTWLRRALLDIRQCLQS